MSSTDTTPKLPRYTHDRHLLVKYLAEPIALTTCPAPPDAINAFYVLAVADDWDDVTLEQIDYITKDTLLAFECVPELIPYSDGRAIDITPLQGDLTEKDHKMFNFGV